MTTSKPVENPVYVASHRRSGTHLTLDSLVNNFSIFAEGFTNFDIEGNLASAKLYKTHAHADHGIDAFLSPARVIYVLRDGRDVMVSLYYYTQSHDSKTRDMSFSDFLHSQNPYDTDSYDGSMNRVEYWNYHVNSWLKQRRFESKIVSFEQWKADPASTIADIAKFTGHSPNRKIRVMAKTKPDTIFSKLLRRAGLSKRTSVQFRGGRSGDWKDHFDQTSLDYFNSVTETTYKQFANVLQFYETVQK